MVRLGDANFDAELVAVQAHCEHGRVGGVEQRRRDLVGSGRDGREDCEPGGGLGGRGQGLGYPASAVVTEGRCSGKLGLNLGDVR